MKLSRLVLSLLALSVLTSALDARAADKKVRALMLTNCKEFTHGPVKR